MRISSIILLPVLFAVSSLSFGATLHSMSKKEIEQAFVNKTFTSIPEAGLQNREIANTFTGTFDDKGNAVGKFSNKPKNEPQTDKGHYSIKDDGTLYITWNHWTDGKETCARLYETKNAYLVTDCENVFQTAFLKNYIQSGNHVK